MGAARAAAAALAAGLLLTGSITIQHASTIAVRPVRVEAPLGPLAAGSSAGMNATNGSASVAGSLLSTTTDLLYLNNTNATSPVHAKLVLNSASGVAGLTSLAIGIRNGSASATQVAATAGSITQTSGSYLRLEPASTNRIYVTQTVSLTFAGSTVDMDLLVADDLAESATVRSKVRVGLT